MGKSLQELGLKDEPLPTTSALDDLPEFGGFRLPPQPGPFRFKLPTDLSHAWDVLTTDKGERVVLILDEHAPLQITQSYLNRYNGEPFHTRLNNNERNRGQSVVASDLHFLVRALITDPEVLKTLPPKSNSAWIRLVNTLGGKEFGSDVTYNYSCNPNRNKRVAAGDGQVIETQERGCGWRYYSGSGQMNASKKIGYVGKQPSGEYPTEVQCQCGAVLRAFANIENIRS